MLLLGGGLCAPALPAWAQSESVRSLVAHVDFESELPTGQPIPRGWVKTELPGTVLPADVRFPKHYLEGRLCDRQPREGRMCFEMSLNGGNLAYTLQPGVPAFADSDYLLTGWVRADGLEAARAQVRLFMVDALGQVVPATMTVSPPLGEPEGPADGQWQPFQVRLRTSTPEVARLQVTLSLLQPEVWQARAELHVYRQDITGSVSWDDLRIYRLPRVRISTDVPGNVFGPAGQPRLRITVQGVEQMDSGVMLTIRDAAGVVRLQQVVDSPSTTQQLAGSAGGEGPQWQGEQWLLPLKMLEPGLYEAELTVSTADQAMTRRTCRFACLAEAPLGGPSGLGACLTDLSMQDMPTALVLAGHMRLGAVKLSAWLGRGEPRAPAAEPAPATAPAAPATMPAGDDAAMVRVLRRVHEQGMRPVLVLDRLPADLVGGAAGARTLLEALAKPPQPLEEAVLLMLARYGLQAGAWQVGGPFNEHVLWDQEAPAAYDTVRQWSGRVLNRQDVLLSWNADFEADPTSRARLSLALDTACQPQEIPDILGPFAGRFDDVLLDAAPDSTERLGRLGDLALRYAYARAAGAHSVFLRPPWRTLEDGSVEPDELLLVARTLAAWLGDAECVGVARLDSSTVAVIFRKADEGRMLIHAQGRDEDAEPLRLELPGAFVVDLWGRRQPLRQAGGLSLVPADSIPVIVAGCDADALALRASLRLAPEVVDSRYDQHTVDLSFINPYGQPVTGTVRITAPEGWTVRPRVLHFSLVPGQEWSTPLSVLFPYRETTGLKKMDVRVEVEAREGRFIEAPAYFYLTLRDVDFDVFHSLQPNGNLEVRATITNRAADPISYECFVQVPDRARQSSLIHQLAPGAQAEKVFHFANGARLHGLTLRTGLLESGGRGVVNRTDVIR